MIIQGANQPLTVKFDASVSSLPALVVTLWAGDTAATPIKKWEIADMTISGDTAICPLTEAETAKMPDGPLTVEAKGMNGDGETLFWDAAIIDVKTRRDRNIALSGVE